MMWTYLFAGAFASFDLVESCIQGPQRSAVVFCQELTPSQQLDVLQRYRSEPTERLALLLGMQQQPAFDLASLVRDEADLARWSRLTMAEVERAKPTPKRRLRRWLESAGGSEDFVVEVMEARGLQIPERIWRAFAASEEPSLRSLAVERLTDVDEATVAAGLANETDEGVRWRWADHAFALTEEPVALRTELTEIEIWLRKALDAEPPWARQWVVDVLSDPNSPDLAWIIRQMAADPPPELWAQCRRYLSRPKSQDSDERGVQQACTAAWRVRTGREDLTFAEAAAVSAQSTLP